MHNFSHVLSFCICFRKLFTVYCKKYTFKLCKCKMTMHCVSRTKCTLGRSATQSYMDEGFCWRCTLVMWSSLWYVHYLLSLSPINCELCLQGYFNVVQCLCVQCLWHPVDVCTSGAGPNHSEPVMAALLGSTRNSMPSLQLYRPHNRSLPPLCLTLNRRWLQIMGVTGFTKVVLTQSLSLMDL